MSQFFRSNASKFLIIIILQCLAVPLLAQLPDALLISFHTDVVVKNNKLVTTRDYKLLVNSRDGDKYTEVTIPYSKMNKVSKIEAYIIDKEGLIIKKLKSADIKDRSVRADFSFYEDNFVKEFSLIHNTYPYTLCYSFQEQADAFLEIENWSPFINDDVPTLQATLTLEVPLDYKIAYQTQFINSFKSGTTDKSIKYEWNSTYRDSINWELFSPAKRLLLPYVRIVPEKFKYELEGSFKSWNTFGNWQYRLLEGLSDLPFAEKEKINSLIAGVNDEKEKIRILYHYLQDETRYINISIKTGGLKPYPASYVAENKYGDCKALSNYFKSVLNFIGIQSFYTKVYADDDIFPIDLSFPAQQFNHIILCVPLKSDTVWLDCTSDGPFDYLGTFTQNRDVFVVEKENSHFVKTPVLKAYEVVQTRRVTINSDLNGIVNTDFHKIYRGNSFDMLSNLNTSVGESVKAQYIRNEFIEDGFDLQEYKIVKANRDSAFIGLNFKAQNNKLFKKYGNELLIRMIPFTIPHFSEVKKRKLPVMLSYPISKLDTLDYRIPEGYSVVSGLNAKALSSAYGNYSVEFKQSKDYVRIIKHFQLNAGSYSLKQYPDFYAFIKLVMDNENNTYIITHKQE